MTFDPSDRSFALGDILLSQLAPLIDGVVPECTIERASADGISWALADGSRFTLEVAGEQLKFRLSGFEGEKRLSAVGLKIGQVFNVRQYLRNGYMSWDGSYFVQTDAARDVVKADDTIANGYAMTALLPQDGEGAIVLGFLRHDRFQSRFTFDFEDGPLSVSLETLIDSKPFRGSVESEALTLFYADAVEPGLRQWAEAVAAHSPVPPRVPERRITGWSSWYNLYASLEEPVLIDHLEAAARFRDRYQVPFDIFQIDDGFTPEMGDWLEFRPQFPDGIAPVMRAAADKDFTPGLWIAPFMVGNRSRLFAEHPDWVVRSRKDGSPLAPMTFYGEFRWHKRSEEYYVLDITHPEAEAYMRKVFRTWAKDWGCGYFKADFLHLGSIYGPDDAVWHEADLSRIEIWMRMARLMREEIGEALLLCCGSPLWAPIGYADAMRIGRDVGVSWSGHYSAQSLLRDQTARNFANGVLWQSDPDCILLRDRFHDLDDNQVKSLANFAGRTGGIVMTSDHLDEVSDERKQLLADLIGDGRAFQCAFPKLGRSALRYSTGTYPNGRPMAVAHADPVLLQTTVSCDMRETANVFNTGNTTTTRLEPGDRATWETVAKSGRSKYLLLKPFQSVQLDLTKR